MHSLRFLCIPTMKLLNKISSACLPTNTRRIPPRHHPWYPDRYLVDFDHRAHLKFRPPARPENRSGLQLRFKGNILNLKGLTFVSQATDHRCAGGVLERQTPPF